MHILAGFGFFGSTFAKLSKGTIGTLGSQLRGGWILFLVARLGILTVPQAICTGTN